jgi:hypothetical protein
MTQLKNINCYQPNSISHHTTHLTLSYHGIIFAIPYEYEGFGWALKEWMANPSFLPPSLFLLQKAVIT